MSEQITFWLRPLKGGFTQYHYSGPSGWAMGSANTVTEAIERCAACAAGDGIVDLPEPEWKKPYYKTDDAA